MPRHTGTGKRIILAGAAYVAMSLSVSAMAQSTPSFAPNPGVGWYAYNRMFIPPASGPGPVMQDPSRPYVSNDEFRVTGRQPTERVADLSTPILQPWARDVVAKRNALILSGKYIPSPTASCWPKGVTPFLLSPMTQPMYFIQGPREVVMVLTSFNDVRRIYLADKHSANVKPSWYGESIGHYEGDTLVVDTIGIDPKNTWVDNFRTPHSDKLHVVERFRVIDSGKTLNVDLHVEDEGAYTMAWNAVQRYDRADQEYVEFVCAENNMNLGDLDPMPVAKTPDF